MKPSLSYAITTHNKLPYLKEMLGRLLASVKEDEEVIVSDGGSTDGTIDYLSVLQQQGKITYLSGPDVGQGHGDNKAILAAQGELIKIIHDDDAFYHPGIQECKRFMLANPEIDVLGAEGASLNWKHSNLPRRTNFKKDYCTWQEKNTPFSFCDLGLLLRRSSLPLLGLFHAGIRRIDYEYTLRITTGTARLAWYTNPIWIRILNPGRLDYLAPQQLQRGIQDARRADAFYFGKQPNPSLIEKLRSTTRSHLRSWYTRLGGSLKPFPFPKNWPAVYTMCDEWLQSENKRTPGQFLVSKPSRKP